MLIKKRSNPGIWPPHVDLLAAGQVAPAAWICAGILKGVMTIFTRDSQGRASSGAAFSGDAAGDATLAASARHDPEAFGTLYRRYVQRVYRYVFSIVNDTLEAEDLTAEVFMAALEGLSGYREQGLFSAWLFAIARNKARAHFRRRFRRQALETPEDVLTSTQAAEAWDPLADFEYVERLQRLQQMVRLLTSEERELLRLRFAAELSFSEIAEVLGRKEAAVKMNLYRLLERLNRDWEKENE